MKTAAPTDSPDFHDTGLQDAYQETAGKIRGFTRRLDNLSRDIKTLEAYLERSAVRVETRVKIPTDSNWEQGQNEYLSWTRGEPDRWRIIYRCVYDFEGRDDEACVLIEAPLDVRVRARNALPTLLRAVADRAMLGEPDDDVPF